MTNLPNQGALAGLYPFLHGTRHEPDKLDAALRHSVLGKARASRETSERFFEDQAGNLVAVAHALAEVYRRQGQLFSMGNGGSSCDAAHVAVEFAHPVVVGQPALAATSLVADFAMISAVGNDLGFDHVFVRQLVARARPGDALIGLSTSGNAKNLLAAFAKARDMGLTTIAFAGGDGGTMGSSDTIDHCLVVPSASIHAIQECHLVAYHILWDLVHALLADDRGSAAGKGEAR